MTVGKLSSDYKNRFVYIDIIRSFAIINMIAFHLIWDLVYIYRFNIFWFKGDIGFIWQQTICFTFILVSGFCFSLSKKPFKRGLTIFAGGALVSLITFVFMPENCILFGILTLIGTAMLILSAFKKPLSRVNECLGLSLSLFLFILFKNIEYGYIGIKPLFVVEMPEWLYSGYISAFLGFPPRSFVSSDYFSVIPWIFLYLFGFYLYKLLEKKDLLKHLKLKKVNGVIKPFIFISKGSFIIYLLHQPIIYFILQIILKD
jgi:uncharacterized membrane protein